MDAIDLPYLLEFFATYGYWVVVIALLLENMGLPIPGETALLVGSALAAQHRLNLEYLIVVGICAAVVGDNLGFALGRWGGRPLLNRYSAFFRISPRFIEDAERLIERHGAPLIGVSRFITGLRMLAGPLAGVLGMRWTVFSLSNVLGASVWVSTLSILGFLFANLLPWLVHVIGGSGVVLGVVAAVVALLAWKLARRRGAGQRG